VSLGFAGRVVLFTPRAAGVSAAGSGWVNGPVTVTSLRQLLTQPGGGGSGIGGGGGADDTAMKKWRIVISGFGAARHKLVLE
jgi:hypothetical protein